MNSNLFERFKSAIFDAIKTSFYFDGDTDILTKNLTDEQFNELLDITALEYAKYKKVNDRPILLDYLEDWMAFIISILYPISKENTERFFKVLDMTSKYSKRLFEESVKNTKDFNKLTNIIYSLEGEDPKRDCNSYQALDLGEGAGLLSIIMDYASRANFDEENEKRFESYIDSNQQLFYCYYVGYFPDYSKTTFLYPTLYESYSKLTDEFITSHYDKFIFSSIAKNEYLTQKSKTMQLIFGDILEHNLNYVKKVVTDSDDKIILTKDERAAILLEFMAN